MQRVGAAVVGQVGADAKGGLDAAAKALVQLDAARNGQPVAEDDDLAARIDTVGLVVLDHAFAPLKRVARIVPRAVEQLAEIHVEIAQKGVHAVHVGQRDPQVTPIFLRPLLEAEHLAVAQARAQRLAGLQVFVRHGAHGAHAQFHGKQHVAGAGELAVGAGAQIGLQGLQHLALPFKRKAPARAVIGNLQIVHALHQRDLVLQPAAALGQVKPRLRVAEVHLADDGQHRNLEHDGVQPGAAHADVDLAIGQGRQVDVLLVELEQAQKVDEIALDEAHAAHVGQLVFGEVQLAQLADFIADLVHVGRQLHAG